MSQIKIYIDEDTMDSDLVVALRSRGVTVVTPLDAGLTEKPDEEQLAFATECGCVLYTFNVSDFYRLHTEWAGAGREHAGMILAPQQRFSVGEQLRRLLRLRATTTAAAMRARRQPWLTPPWMRFELCCCSAHSP
ncbi:conserved hypothetical protein [Candidatus Sulfopaludibacter sp. SbA4]|nr:conserved hypothetical protein [Candidatus Sulfopaludibacter sp. SbA4]